MIFGIWGPDKSCKTTLALSAPKPLVVMEFDIGGFERAKRNLPHLPIADWVRQGLIRYEAYPMPVQVGQLDPATMSVRPSKIIVGIKELFYRWLTAYLGHLRDTNLASVVVDTSTLLYSITCDGYLQEKQEIQLDSRGNILPGEKLRVQLTQLEYREPNNRMRGIIYNAKAAGKNLILTHHERDEYKLQPQKDGSLAQSPTGRKERAGFATLGDSADFIVHTYIKEEIQPVQPGQKPTYLRVPYCKVELASVQELVGMELATPTFDMIDRIAKMMRGEV